MQQHERQQNQQHEALTRKPKEFVHHPNDCDNQLSIYTSLMHAEIQLLGAIMQGVKGNSGIAENIQTEVSNLRLQHHYQTSIADYANAAIIRELSDEPQRTMDLGDFQVYYRDLLQHKQESTRYTWTHADVLGDPQFPDQLQERASYCYSVYHDFLRNAEEGNVTSLQEFVDTFIITHPNNTVTSDMVQSYLGYQLFAEMDSLFLQFPAFAINQLDRSLFHLADYANVFNFRKYQELFAQSSAKMTQTEFTQESIAEQSRLRNFWIEATSFGLVMANEDDPQLEHKLTIIPVLPKFLSLLGVSQGAVRDVFSRFSDILHFLDLKLNQEQLVYLADKAQYDTFFHDSLERSQEVSDTIIEWVTATFQAEFEEKPKIISLSQEQVSANIIREKLGLRPQYDVCITVIGGVIVKEDGGMRKIMSHLLINALDEVNKIVTIDNKAMVVASSGSDQGVIGMAGSARLKAKKDSRDFDFVGVLPYEYTWGEGGKFTWEEFVTERGHTRENDETFLLTAQNPYVSHKIFVGNSYAGDRLGPWHTASDVLVKLAADLGSDGKKVTVLLNGGEGVAYELPQILQRGERVILVKKSGRFTDALIAAKEGREADIPEVDTINLEKFKTLSGDAYDTYMTQLKIFDPFNFSTPQDAYSSLAQQILNEE